MFYPSDHHHRASTRSMPNRFSRSGLLEGGYRDEKWSDADQFCHDHIAEVIGKLPKLDDEIWGKIVLMERNKRTAKAYTRTTTVVVNGSTNGFDGKTIGFNSFDNDERDKFVMQIKSKIHEGVMLRMDASGNIIAIAGGLAPIYVQGWQATRAHCFGDRLIRQQGRLTSADPAHQVTERERAVKVFDMKIFKSVLQRVAQQEYIDADTRRDLLHRTCIRMSLVKQTSDPIKTPCWFMLINLVALDMLNTKLASLSDVPPPPPRAQSFPMGISRAASQDTLAPPSASMPLHARDLIGSLMHQQSATNLHQMALQAQQQQQQQTQLGPLLAAAFGAGPWAPQQQPPPTAGLGDPFMQQLAAHLAQQMNMQVPAGARNPHGMAKSVSQSNIMRNRPGYLSESDLSSVGGCQPRRRTRQQKFQNHRSMVNLAAGRRADIVYEPVREEHDDIMTELPTDDDDEFTDYGGNTTAPSTRRSLGDHDDGANFTMRKRADAPKPTIPKQFIQPPPPPPELLATSPTPTTSSSTNGSAARRLPQWSCGSLTSDYDSATVSSLSRDSTTNVYHQVVSKAPVNMKDVKRGSASGSLMSANSSSGDDSGYTQKAQDRREKPPLPAKPPPVIQPRHHRNVSVLGVASKPRAPTAIANGGYISCSDASTIMPPPVMPRTRTLSRRLANEAMNRPINGENRPKSIERRPPPALPAKPKHLVAEMLRHKALSKSSPMIAAEPISLDEWSRRLDVAQPAAPPRRKRSTSSSTSIPRRQAPPPPPTKDKPRRTLMTPNKFDKPNANVTFIPDVWSY